MDVREHGTLFSAPMVLALYDGKSQTRRVVTDRNSRGNWKPSQCDMATAWVDPGPSPAGNPGPYLKANVTARDDGIVDRIYPQWQVRDRLWVRETFFDHGDNGDPSMPLDERVEYRAEPWDRQCEDREAGPWTPSIHMPRKLSRLTLTLSGIRPERLQDISEEDAVAEGIERSDEPGIARWPFLGALHPIKGTPKVFATAVQAYRSLWDSLNAKRGYGWDANPWVWVLAFARVAT